MSACGYRAKRTRLFFTYKKMQKVSKTVTTTLAKSSKKGTGAEKYDTKWINFEKALVCSACQILLTLWKNVWSRSNHLNVLVLFVSYLMWFCARRRTPLVLGVYALRHTPAGGTKCQIGHKSCPCNMLNMNLDVLNLGLPNQQTTFGLLRRKTHLWNIKPNASIATVICPCLRSLPYSDASKFWLACLYSDVGEKESMKTT